jgi:hypothetical protein
LWSITSDVIAHERKHGTMRRFRDAVTVVAFGLVLIIVGAGTATADDCPVDTGELAGCGAALTGLFDGLVGSLLGGFLGGGCCTATC